jgi:hypothetical protein
MPLFDRGHARSFSASRTSKLFFEPAEYAANRRFSAMPHLFTRPPDCLARLRDLISRSRNQRDPAGADHVDC